MAAPARKMKLASRMSLLGTVQREMNRRGLTCYALAQMLELTAERHLGYWLRGEKTLSDIRVDEVLKVLGIKLLPPE